MRVTLSTDDCTRLEAAARTLLSPFAYPTMDAWRGAVNACFRALVEADHALFFLPPAPDGPGIYSDDLPPEVVAQAAAGMGQDQGMRRALAFELGVFNRNRVVAGDWAGYWRDPIVNEIHRPNGLLDGIGYLQLPTEGTFAALGLYRERGGTERFDEFGCTLMGLLRPAFRAGVEMQLMVANQCAALTTVVEGLSEGALIADAAGTTQYESATLRALLAADPERERIRCGIRLVVETLVARWRRGGAARWRDGRPLPVVQDITTVVARYRIRGCEGGAVVGYGTRVLVTVARTSGVPLADDALRTTYGLTPREIIVARLLAGGHANAAIATTLGIRPATARRHTEAVLGKLGVSSRAQVAGRLAEGAPPAAR
ncbi:MAG TPA: helix-turn-helix transcriptional regulator [Gemmatimonadales bacterium]|nr:helix-turn-helix transcriptional regulator [Gemmatimonadales bacterium]